MTLNKSVTFFDKDERVINVADIDKSVRHTVIMQLVENLDIGASLQIRVDHNPLRLRGSIEMHQRRVFIWDSLEGGPPIWKIRIRCTG